MFYRKVRAFWVTPGHFSFLCKHGIEWHTIKCYNGIVKNWAERHGSFFMFECAGIGDAGAGGRAGLHKRGRIGVNQKQFYQTRAWKRARDAYVSERVAIDGGICEACGEELGKIVHHYKIWLDDINCNDPDISLNPENFKYECQTCHNKEVDPRKETPGRCTYGPNGEIIQKTEW